MLVADIGGTNARFGLAEQTSEAWRIHSIQRYHTKDYPTIIDAVNAYLSAGKAHPNQACFAVAAPLYGDEIKFTHNDWDFKISQAKATLGFNTLKVVNDFEALAAGIAHLPANFFHPVQDGIAVAEAPSLVIGPGTGLGQALLVPTREGMQIVSTQGGHIGFAPRNAFEIDILRTATQSLDRVTAERFLSGAGLVNLYRAVCAVTSVTPHLKSAKHITDAAIEATDTLAQQSVDVFCAILGSVVGDAILSTGARGGVYLAGGILPKIKDVFLRSQFKEALLDRNPMQSYVENVPIQMIVKDGAALYGAAALFDAD